jgi:SulP family sulfate permease
LVLALLAVIFACLDAAFVFSGPFQPYLASTLPVFLLAGAVLMAVLGATSRFGCLYTGFQDEAVVILAAIGAALAERSGGVVDDRLYASMLAVVAVATLGTGLLFLLLGTLRLGRLIRYVPFSVTAGFMITIGALLASGGVALAESRDFGAVISGLTAGTLPWKGLFALAVAAAIVLAGRRGSAVAVMPVVCLVTLLAFYGVSALAGLDAAALARAGWLPPAADATAHANGWQLLLANGVDWSLVAGEWRSLLSLAVISALALLLAVTALELVTRQRVDVDQELRAAGLANLGTALAGGAAGYHDDAVTAMLHKSLGGDRLTVLAAAALCALVAVLDPGWFGRCRFSEAFWCGSAGSCGATGCSTAATTCTAATGSPWWRSSR